jgi:hypothetical protein
MKAKRLWIMTSKIVIGGAALGLSTSHSPKPKKRLVVYHHPCRHEADEQHSWSVVAPFSSLDERLFTVATWYLQASTVGHV